MTIMKFHFVQENEVLKNIGKYFGNELGRKNKTISLVGWNKTAYILSVQT